MNKHPAARRHSARIASRVPAPAPGPAAAAAAPRAVPRGPPLTPSEQFAAEGGAQLLTAMAASHLPEVLRTIDGGAFAAEAPVRSVQLGVQELVCTHQRLVHLKWSPSGDEILKTWNVPWRRVKGVELQRDRHRVLMLLFSTRELPADSGEPADALHPPSRQVECGNAAATRLVYDAIQTGRALHGEREAMLQLAASSGP
mmetsp:Transcript_12657/g.42020  ORF Transcript_12657/g.42020 Transcript_12657/m.42020 type:complete len:200 (-) Transcript_12657:167-766(-)